MRMQTLKILQKKKQQSKVLKKLKHKQKTNNILYKDILANLNKSTEGLLKTSFGVKKIRYLQRRNFFFRTFR